MTKPVLDFVEIVENVKEDFVSVQPHWKGVDRPNTGGYTVSLKHKPLALRLKIALESGALWIQEPKIATDVNGKTYVNADIKILMRKCNSELKRLGF